MIKDLNTLIERAQAIVNNEGENNKVSEAVAKLFDITKKWTPDDESSWIDLGLPSGNLWYDRNVSGFYTFDKAKETFGEYLPSATAMAELYENCEWEWTGRGYKVIGPNGNSIFLPADGNDCGGKGSYGYYWTRCESKTSQTGARRLYFSSGSVGPLDDGNRSYGFSVRPCREL